MCIRIITLLLLLLPQFTYAQKNETPSKAGITGSFWFGYGSANTWEAGGSLTRFVPGKGLAYGIQATNGSFKDPDAPADYSPGLVIFGDGDPLEVYTSISPFIKTVQPLAGRRWLMYASGGPALLIVNRNVEYIRVSNRGLFGSNYQIVTKQNLAAGFRADAGVMMRIGRIAALNFGLYFSGGAGAVWAGAKLGFSFGSHKRLFWK